MKPDSQEVKRVLIEFENLKSALIDSSSIIYLNRINMIGLLTTTIPIYIIEEINHETGLEIEGLTIITHDLSEKMTTDVKLITSAYTHNLPIISDDKRILTRARDHGLVYYNSVMMLCYLIFCNAISPAQYQRCERELFRFARYSNYVKTYSRTICNAIIKRGS